MASDEAGMGLERGKRGGRVMGWGAPEAILCRLDKAVIVKQT
jgi:hypothetical protein